MSTTTPDPARAPRPDPFAPPPPGPVCMYCRLWQRNDAVTGQCKARPPQPHHEPPPGFVGCLGVWPLTMQADWCGGFILREGPPDPIPGARRPVPSKGAETPAHVKEQIKRHVAAGTLPGSGIEPEAVG
jgi:hypothetical protein